MSKETEIIVEKVAEETAKLIPEIYEDGLKPSVQEVGGVIATLFGLVNHVLLYKPKTWITMYKLKAQKFEEDYKKRIDLIPEENKGNPDINVIGPLLESLKYNLDEDEIREMFLNLLVNSIDNRTSSKVHPSFVSIVSRMNSVDAIILKGLYNKYNGNYIKSSKINITIIGSNQYYSNALPEWIIEDEFINISIFELSESLIRLQNFGIITLMFDRSAGESNIDIHSNKKEVQDIFNKYKLYKNPSIELKGTDCIIYINDFGKKFSQIVLSWYRFLISHY